MSAYCFGAVQPGPPRLRNLATSNAADQAPIDALPGHGVPHPNVLLLVVIAMPLKRIWDGGSRVVWVLPEPS